MQANIQTPGGYVSLGQPDSNPGGQLAFTNAAQDFSAANGSALPAFATMTPSATRIVTLPPVASCAGRWFTMKNLAVAQVITVNEAGGAPVGANVAASTSAIYYCNGVAWVKMIQLAW